MPDKKLSALCEKCYYKIPCDNKQPNKAECFRYGPDLTVKYTPAKCNFAWPYREI